MEYTTADYARDEQNLQMDDGQEQNASMSSSNKDFDRDLRNLELDNERYKNEAEEMRARLHQMQTKVRFTIKPKKGQRKI